MKIGLFGGTFNPIHFGHLTLVERLQKFWCFDQFYFIPSRNPPHKDINKVATFVSRCEMILRSLPGNLKTNLSIVDVERMGLSYILDTVIYFDSKMKTKNKFYFILGMDAFLEFHTWKLYNILLKMVNFIVIDRNNTSFCKDNFIGEYIYKNLSSGYRFFNKNFCWYHEILKPIYYFKLRNISISSSLVRKNVKLGKDISRLVLPSVEDYIRVKKLYR